MKILYHILYPLGMGDDRTIYDGFKYAFEDMGHRVFPLTERDSLGSKLREIKPDIFMTTLNLIDLHRDEQALKQYRSSGGKIFAKAGWLESEAHAEIIRMIRNDEGADWYFSEIEIPHFAALTGRPIHLLPLAASRQYNFPTAPSKKYDCDIIYIGANLSKKRDMFERRLFPLFKKYKVRVFGSDWDWMDRYILHPLATAERKIGRTSFITKLRFQRQVPVNEENVAYSSAKICLNFHEKQPNDIYLLNSRTFKIPASGGFEISDYVPLIRKYFDEDELVMAQDDEDFFEKIDYYMAHDKERKLIQEKGTAKALREHTYHNRARQILDWHQELMQKSL